MHHPHVRSPRIPDDEDRLVLDRAAAYPGGRSGRLAASPTPADHEVIERVRRTDWTRVTLDLADPHHRHLAARATALGTALFYSFGNFCALAGRAHRASVERINRLKGRPAQQVGSVTTTPERLVTVFDWTRLPDGLAGEQVQALMDDFFQRGPMGFRGPAAGHVPAHLTSDDAGITTTQLIAPGYACASNALIGETLALLGEDLLFITSANRSSRSTGQPEPPHYEVRGLQTDFGDQAEVVLIGHRDEAAVRARYPQLLPMSTSIIAVHTLARDEGGRPALVLERHGSLAVGEVRALVARHGFGLVLGEQAHCRLPWRGRAAGSVT